MSWASHAAPSMSASPAPLRAMVVDAKSSVETANAAAMKGREPFGLRSLIASM
jgi:hypothetical protein